jgi:hypothetical protein
MDQTTAKAQALAALHATRQDAYNSNITVITTDGKIALQTYLKNHGISESTYVNIPWSGTMEKISNQRSAEAAAYAQHTRPDGTSTFTTSADGQTSYGEILAWGYSTMTSAVSEGWAGEKADYLKYISGGTGYGQWGHYSIMVSPSYKSFGMSGFQYTSESYGLEWSWSGEFGNYTQAASTTSITGSRSADFTTIASRFTPKSISLSSNTVAAGSTVNSTVTASALDANSLTGWNGRFVLDSVSASAGTFTVSDTSKATVNASSGVVTGKNAGTVTVSFKNASTGVTVISPALAVTGRTPSDNNGNNSNGGSNNTNNGGSNTTPTTTTNVSKTYNGFQAGTYYIVPKWNYTSSMDIPGGSTANGVVPQEYSGNRSAAQQFVFSKNTDGTWKITVKGTGKVLDVYGGSSANGARLNQYADNGSAAQKWTVQDNGDGSMRILSKVGTTISVNGGSSANGAKFQMWKFNGDKSQRFYVIPVDTTVTTGSPVRFASSGNTDYGVNIPGNTTNNSSVWLHRNDGTTANQFVLRAKANGFYEIRGARSNKCLDVPGASGSNGVGIQQYSCNGSAAQAWFPIGLGDKVYAWYNAASGKTLDINSGKLVDGSKIQQYASNHSAAQQWLVK